VCATVRPPSKFTADRRQAIVALLGAGASRRKAAAAVDIDHATLLRWLRRGEKAAPGGRWREFYEAVIDAEAHPSLRPLERIYSRELEDGDPLAALRLLERSEPEVWGRKRPSPRPNPPGPVVIQLEWPPPALPGDEDGEWDEDD
jgi:transposase-like protein